MSAENENPPASPAETVSIAKAARPIRLQPSSSNYETFAKTTANAMGKSAPTGSSLSPNKLLLSLVNLGP